MHHPKPAYIKWFSGTGILLLLALLPRCMSLHMSDKKVAEYFKDAPAKPSFYEYTLNNHRIHYAAMGADTLPMVVFVHGSPGSWDAFISFFKDTTLYKTARIVSVDRPGFGKSGYGKVEKSLQAQAALLMPILQTSRSTTQPLLVGHSLGGPVVSRMAMDYPHLVGGLILVAPSIDPELERWEWYRHLGKFFLFRAIIPKELDVSNQEILPLKKELASMLPMWATIQVPVTVIQGEEDKLVPPGNATFARKMLVNAPTQVWMILDMNHFIPWSRPDLITQAILEWMHSHDK
ncbi:alpha/beta hydrolase [Rhodocytophaga rosea]|uniref:Alpha/beta hydrolase n=1 Tax=Rhodocytophaga rosea TaxID=2704465 RepID=A0A6C0GUA7_9BACT|nr:alpha/beta hydrolase [Rhodocytophaga rosea]QHT71789.1 alpha/beta hydrolase [Rhodocytophaga rosea]